MSRVEGKSGHQTIEARCPLVTQLRHQPASHVAVAKPVSAPIKALAFAPKMPSPELGVGHEAARFHQADW